MPLTNYRDLSRATGDLNAGFQFEFYCDSCGETWKTPFKPYRAGQAAGIFRRISFVLGEFYRVGAITDMVSKVGRASGTSADMSGSKAKVAALEEVMLLAEERYHRCTSCSQTVCDNCWDESTRTCVKCQANATQSARYEAAATAAATLSCPNCQTPSQGGRFCHECGFDMASTHKSCPACGATMPRQSRFCTDCGHAF
jgi:hypothetical protein